MKRVVIGVVAVVVVVAVGFGIRLLTGGDEPRAETPATTEEPPGPTDESPDPTAEPPEDPTTAPGVPAALGRADETLFSLVVGELIDYGGTLEDQRLWGPTGIAVGADGTIWLADGVGRQVLGLTRTGDVVTVLPFHERLESLNDIAAYDDKIVVLDDTARDPRDQQILVVLVPDGDVLASVPLPDTARLETGLSGVTVMSDGTIVAELEGGTRVVPLARLTEGSPEVGPVSGSLSAYATPLGEVTKGAGAVWIDGTRVTPSVDHTLGTVRLVGATADTVFVGVADVSTDSDGTMHVDLLVHAFDAAGNSRGVARLPLSEDVTPPGRPVTVTADGELVALVLREQAVDVVSLGLRD